MHEKSECAQKASLKTDIFLMPS